MFFACTSEVRKYIAFVVKRSLDMLQCVAVCCSVLQCVAVCCSGRVRWISFTHDTEQFEAHCCSVLQCVAACCSVLQCVAVCCSVLQCVAVCSGLQCKGEMCGSPFY